MKLPGGLIDLQESFKAWSEAHFNKRSLLQKDFENRLVAAYRKKHNKKRKIPAITDICKDLGDEAERIKAPLQVEADQLIDEYKRAEERIMAVSNWLANRRPVVAKDNVWTMCDVVYFDTYRSQGYGQARYALAAAAMSASYYEKHGLKTHIHHNNTSCNYEVWVNTDEENTLVAAHKPLPVAGDWLEEFCSDCWKNNVNPLVYNPFLPEAVVWKTARERTKQ